MKKNELIAALEMVKGNPDITFLVDIYADNDGYSEWCGTDTFDITGLSKSGILDVESR